MLLATSPDLVTAPTIMQQKIPTQPCRQDHGNFNKIIIVVIRIIKSERNKSDMFGDVSVRQRSMCQSRTATKRGRHGSLPCKTRSKRIHV